MALKPVEHEMPKKKTMTLRDVEAWVTDARANGATGDEQVTVDMSWSNGIRKLSIKVEMVAPERVTP